MSGGAVVLDVSRLLSRADRSTPTGIDRVEHAYARRLIDTEVGRLRFAAADARGRLALLPRLAAARFVERVERVWEAGDGRPDPQLKRMAQGLAAAAMVGDGGRSLRARRGAPRPTYLVVSHQNLDRPLAVGRFRREADARFVPLVHDLIPILWPEYNRPGQDATHARRMATVAEQADAVIVYSQGSADGVAPFLAAAGRAPPVVLSPIGVSLRAGSPSPRAPGGDGGGEGGFVCVCTIEPRKNHLLLFNVWRRLAAELGPATPRLHVVGHRGWHNEAVFDALDRSATLRPHVTEHAGLADAEMARLMAGARAVLMPSFAEGYGLPIAEALAAGVPVLCSDLATFRDVGGAAPEYLDPIDGPAWVSAVRDYADSASPRRLAQLERMRGWRPPTWEAHFAAVAPHLRDDADATG